MATGWNPQRASKVWTSETMWDIKDRLTLLVRTTYLKRKQIWSESERRYDGHTLHQKQQRYRPIHLDLNDSDLFVATVRKICIFTVEFRTKLSSKIGISPVRWISLIHESGYVLIWIVSFPSLPKPMRILIGFGFFRHKTSPFRWKWRNTEDTPVNKDAHFAFIIPCW